MMMIKPGFAFGWFNRVTIIRLSRSPLTRQQPIRVDQTEQYRQYREKKIGFSFGSFLDVLVLLFCRWNDGLVLGFRASRLLRRRCADV